MSIAEQVDTRLPVGTWRTDPVHSRVSFVVGHMGVSEFHGAFRGVEATLDATGLRGTVRIENVRLDDDPTQETHVLSPDFLDAERHPVASFESTAVRRSGEEVEVEGELTVRGNVLPVALRGTIAGPTADPYGGERIGIVLATVVDRRSLGVDWNAPLPGGGDAIGWDVRLTASLQLVRAEA
jgi:polyisoprenoid-binding protein YceI